MDDLPSCRDSTPYSVVIRKAFWNCLQLSGKKRNQGSVALNFRVQEPGVKGNFGETLERRLLKWGLLQQRCVLPPGDRAVAVAFYQPQPIAGSCVQGGVCD